MTRYLRLVFFVCSFAGLLTACTTNDLYEKVVFLPGHQWKSSNQPVFTFNITDTSARYKISLVFRHTEKYNFNNLWCRLYYTAPGDSTIEIPTRELELASNEKGFAHTGVAMDDIYEHHLVLNQQQLFRASKKGVYTFKVAQIMREDPLQHVMNVGLRVEKVN